MRISKGNTCATLADSTGAQRLRKKVLVLGMRHLSRSQPPRGVVSRIVPCHIHHLPSTGERPQQPLDPALHVTPCSRVSTNPQYTPADLEILPAARSKRRHRTCAGGIPSQSFPTKIPGSMGVTLWHDREASQHPQQLYRAAEAVIWSARAAAALF